MNGLGVILGATAIIVAGAASARAQSGDAVGVGPGVTEAPGHVLEAPFFLPDGQTDAQRPRPLFTIGGLQIDLWAPIESYYDANVNRNLAADPLWAD